MRSASRRSGPHRRAMALVLTVLVLTVLLATAAQLATLSGTRALINDRRSRTLQHRLAVDSTIALVAQAMANDEKLGRTLDRERCIHLAFGLGDCQVQVRLQDDGAKFNVLPFSDERSLSLLRRKLQDLGRLMRLPEEEITPRPVFIPKDRSGIGQNPEAPTAWAAYSTFDQLLAATPPSAVFHWTPGEDNRSAPVWSDYVSLFGDGRIDLRRADSQLVELALRDIQGGLAVSGHGSQTLDEALTGLDSGIRPQVTARLGYGLDRYALTIHTAIGADVRRWYVVAVLKPGAATVLHRQQITW